MKVISERYASALLDVALAHGTAEKVKMSLDGFRGGHRGITGPAAFSGESRGAARIEARGAERPAHQIGAAPNMQNFLSLVVEHRRAGLMPEIAVAYTRHAQ